MDKSRKYMELLKGIEKTARDAVLYQERDVDLEIVQMMRELRQFIEQLRRLLEGGDAPAKFLTREEIARLGRDELAFIVDGFFEWYNEDECPRDRCDDYFCRHCQRRKEEADEALADGELDPEDYDVMAGNHFFDEMCDDMQEGCWADYYLWCYRSGYDPLTGKKMEADRNGK